MTAPPRPRCGCTVTVVATIEETLTCPARWEYRPGTGWIHEATQDAPLRGLILEALAQAVASRRADVAFCHDCASAVDGLCPDHRGDSALADGYEQAYQRVTGIGSDGAILALTRKRWARWPES